MEASYKDNTRTISRAIISASIIWFVICAIAFSNAGSNTIMLVMAIYVGGTWGVIWLLRLVVTLWRKRQGKEKYKLPKQPLLFWLFEPSVIVASLVLSQLGVFSSIRFALSEQALSSYVENVRAGKIDLAFEFNHPSRQVGLYSVSFTDLMPDGTVRLITSSHGLMDKAGFANSQHNPPPSRGEDSYKHIHQQWWYWYESW